MPLPKWQTWAAIIVWLLVALSLMALLFALAVGLGRLVSVGIDDGLWAALQSVDARGVGLAAGGVATMVGVAIAALVGYYKFQLFRESRPHLTIELSASHRKVSPRYIHIGVTARLSNTSKVAVTVATATWNLTALAPYTDAAAERLHNDYVRSYQHDGDEFGESVQKPAFSQFDLIIEPGETDGITFDFITAADLKSVAITLFIYNDAASTETAPLGWGRRIFYDLVD